jgi:anti-sigma B factor antagonist
MPRRSETGEVSLDGTRGITLRMREPASEQLGEVELRIEEHPTPGATVLAVRGEADLHSAPRLRDAIATAIEDGAQELVLDLTETTFVDSMILGVLLGTMKRLRARGGQLRLVVASAEIRRIFEITQLDRVLPLYDTREEAVGAAAASDGP